MLHFTARLGWQYPVSASCCYLYPVRLNASFAYLLFSLSDGRAIAHRQRFNKFCEGCLLT
jgi:hypothetical protein